MRNEVMHSTRLIVITFVLALMLDIVPLPHALTWWRPDFPLLVLLYWVMIAPYRISVGVGFLIGLLMDLLNGSLFGQYAFVFVLLAYLMAKFAGVLRLLSLPLQAAGIFALLVLTKVLVYLLMSMQGQVPNTFLFWVSVLPSVIVWVIASVLL